ncbi:MAG: SAM-dependent methyltransferase, partial [Lysobacter sp.]
MNELARSDARDGSAFGALDRFLRKRLLAHMAELRDGRLLLEDDCGTELLGAGPAGASEPPLCLRVHGPGFYRALAANGSVGAGEAYMDGLWECDDLVGLVRLLVRNRDLLDGMETGLAKLGGLAMRALHAL